MNRASINTIKALEIPTSCTGFRKYEALRGNSQAIHIQLREEASISCCEC